MFENEDSDYWKKFVLSSVLIAAGSALVTETAKVLADKLRERWNLKESK